MRWMTMQALSARRYLARRVTGLHGEGARVLMVFVRGLQVGRIPRGRQLPQRRGLHSSTFQLNLSALHGIRVALIV